MRQASRASTARKGLEPTTGTLSWLLQDGLFSHGRRTVRPARRRVGSGCWQALLRETLHGSGVVAWVDRGLLVTRRAASEASPYCVPGQVCVCGAHMRDRCVPLHPGGDDSLTSLTSLVLKSALAGGVYC